MILRVLIGVILIKKIEEGVGSITIACDRNISNNEIDDLLTNITELLQKTIVEDVPKTTIKQAGQIPLPKQIILVIRYKNKLRKIWHRNKYCNTRSKKYIHC